MCDTTSSFPYCLHSKIVRNYIPAQLVPHSFQLSSDEYIDCIKIAVKMMGSGSFEVRSSPFYRQLCVPTEHISNIKLSQTIPKHHTPFYGFCSDCIQKKTEAGTNTNTRTTSVFRTATLSKIKQDLSGVVCIDIEGLVLEKMRLSQKEQHIAKAASSIVAFSVH